MLEWKTPNVGFEKLLSTKAGRELFGSFLEKEFSSENLKFWIACEDVKQIKEAAQFSQQVEAIFNKFIDPSALDEVLWSLLFCTNNFISDQSERLCERKFTDEKRKSAS